MPELNSDILSEKLSEAIDGTVIRQGRACFPVESCSVIAGFCETPDGRRAQVIITVQSDEDEWID